MRELKVDVIVLLLLSVIAGTQGALPVFATPASDGSSTLSIGETTTASTSIYTVSATDTGLGTLTYTLTAQSPGSNFQLTGQTLSLASTIDFEAGTTTFTLTFEASTSSTSQTSTTSIVVTVTDVNDETPVFGGTFTATIDEEQPVGTIVSIPFTVADADAGDVLSYSLTGTTNFQIDSGSGAITISQVIDYDAGSTSFTFNLVVKDSASPVHTATQALTVTINNINDNTPVFAPAVYYVSIAENTASSISVAQLTVTDGDTGDTVTVSIQSGDDASAKFAVSTALIETSSTALDYDTLAGQNFMYTLVVIGVDTGPLTGTATVFVTVTNQNEATPVFQTFTPATSPYSVNENEAAGTSIVTITATDADAGTDGALTYSLGTITPSGSGSTTGLFHLDGTTRILSVSSGTLDRDTSSGGNEYYDIVVQAVDQGTSPLSVTQTVRVSLTDLNDNSPVCSASPFTATISENVATSYSVLTIAATDNDATTANNVVSYDSISGGSGSALFTVDSSTGVLSTSGTIDYETATTYDIEITVSDSGSPALSVTCVARITISDLNDNAPTFPATSLTVTVAEDATSGTTVATAQATDLDSSTSNNNVIVYSFSTASSVFGVVGGTGVITTATTLDRETIPSYILTVYATDQGSPANTGTITYTVSLTDVNDNPPVITGTYDTTITEDTPINTLLFTITATDADEGQNAVLTYAITNGDTNSDFFIDAGSGLIQVRNTLDRENTDMYNLEITVTDSGTTPQSASITATVTIGDINDNSPVFSLTQYSFSVIESATSGTSVDTVTATDADAGTNAVIAYTQAYFVTGDSSHFSLASGTGIVNTAGTLDRETADTYVMVIRATDTGSTPLTGTATVTVSVTDYNDNTPTFSAASYTATTTENEAVGTSILAVTVTDLDIGVNANIVLSVDTGTSAGTRADLYINPDSGTSTLLVKQAIDRETDSSFVFNLVATDQGTPALSSTTVINITVNDVNDNAPVFSPSFYSTEIAYNDDCQSTVVTITATDADEGANAAVTYATTQNTHSSIFSLNANTGAVTLVSPATSDTKYVITASASDGGTPSMTSASDATIRIDTYNPSAVMLNYYMDISCSTYLASESTFLTQLTAVYGATYVSPEAKRWCTVETSSTSCVVRVYVIKDDTADALSELANPKSFLTMDEAFAITSADTIGTPASVITGASWTAFSLTRVERYYTDPSSDSDTSWFETTTGIAVMSAVGAAALIAIVTGFSLAYYYSNKKPNAASKTRVGAMNNDKVANRMFRYDNISDTNGHKKASMPRVSVDDTNIKPKSVPPIKNRQFDGQAVDASSGRVYNYNTKSGTNSWIRTPDGDPNIDF